MAANRLKVETVGFAGPITGLCVVTIHSREQPERLGLEIYLLGINQGIIKPFLGFLPVQSQVDQTESNIALGPVGTVPHRIFQCVTPLVEPPSRSLQGSRCRHACARQRKPHCGEPVLYRRVSEPVAKEDNCQQNGTQPCQFQRNPPGLSRAVGVDSTSPALPRRLTTEECVAKESHQNIVLLVGRRGSPVGCPHHPSSAQVPTGLTTCYPS